MATIGNNGTLPPTHIFRMPSKNVRPKNFKKFIEFIYFSHNFKFSQPEPFFRILYGEILANRIELTDLFQIDFEIKQTIFECIRSPNKFARKN
jgi:hypothetical protein